MAAFQVKRASVSGIDDPAHTISKLVWETPLLTSGELPIVNGGTGAATAAAARTNLGLGNVDNTSDAAKPISAATQTALNAKASLTHTHAIADITGLQAALANAGGSVTDPELLAIAGLTSAANTFAYFTGSGTAALAALSPFARTFLGDADAAAVRTTLGVPATVHTHVIADITGLQAALNAGAISDPELIALAGLTSAANKLPYFTGAGTAALADLSIFARTFLDDADAATVRATLGAAATAHTHVVADTTGLQTALDAKAPLVSPTFSGAVNVPTPTAGDNSTKAASTAFVTTAVAAAGGGGVTDPELLALAGVTSAANKLPYFTGAGTASVADLSAFARTFLDDADAATVRGTIAAAAAAHTHVIADTTGLQAALDAKSADTRSINTQTGAAYTLVLTDKGGLVVRANAAPNTTTVPTNAAVAFPVGTQIDILQDGAGQSALAPAGGVTLRSAGAKLKIAGQYSAATLVKKATDEWWFFGDIAA
jgi:hypothetical protein